MRALGGHAQHHAAPSRAPCRSRSSASGTGSTSGGRPAPCGTTATVAGSSPNSAQISSRVAADGASSESARRAARSMISRIPTVVVRLKVRRRTKVTSWSVMAAGTRGRTGARLARLWRTSARRRRARRGKQHLLGPGAPQPLAVLAGKLAHVGPLAPAVPPQGGGARPRGHHRQPRRRALAGERRARARACRSPDRRTRPGRGRGRSASRDPGSARARWYASAR